MKLANHRLDVAEENAKDGSQAWAFLRLVARYLRQEGMSSDESGTEQRKYVVRIRLWRSKALIPYLDMIDEDFNDTGGVSGRVTETQDANASGREWSSALGERCQNCR